MTLDLDSRVATVADPLDHTVKSLVVHARLANRTLGEASIRRVYQLRHHR